MVVHLNNFFLNLEFEIFSLKMQYILPLHLVLLVMPNTQPHALLLTRLCNKYIYKIIVEITETLIEMVM